MEEELLTFADAETEWIMANLDSRRIAYISDGDILAALAVTKAYLQNTNVETLEPPRAILLKFRQAEQCMTPEQAAVARAELLRYLASRERSDSDPFTAIRDIISIPSKMIEAVDAVSRVLEAAGEGGKAYSTVFDAFGRPAPKDNSAGKKKPRSQTKPQKQHSGP